MVLDTKLTVLEEKYPLKHPYAKLRAATKVLVATIPASNACITANTYLVKKIAMITKNGVQLPEVSDPSVRCLTVSQLFGEEFVNNRAQPRVNSRTIHSWTIGTK